MLSCPKLFLLLLSSFLLSSTSKKPLFSFLNNLSILFVLIKKFGAKKIAFSIFGEREEEKQRSIGPILPVEQGSRWFILHQASFPGDS